MICSLEPIESLYFLSLVVMIVVTNVRPIFINYWNKTEYLINKNKSDVNLQEDLEQWESDIMVANQIIITVLGSNIVKCLVLETLLFILTCC